MIQTVSFDAFDTLLQVEKSAAVKYIIDRITQCGYTVDVAKFHKIWKGYYSEIHPALGRFGRRVEIAYKLLNIVSCYFLWYNDLNEVT